MRPKRFLRKAIVIWLAITILLCVCISACAIALAYIYSQGNTTPNSDTPNSVEAGVKTATIA